MYLINNNKPWINCNDPWVKHILSIGGIPLSRAPQIFRRNTRFALTGIRPDYQFLLLIFAAIWGSDFRDNLIALTRLFKQAKQIRIPFMAMFKVNTCPPNEVR